MTSRLLEKYALGPMEDGDEINPPVVCDIIDALGSNCWRAVPSQDWANGWDTAVPVAVAMDDISQSELRSFASGQTSPTDTTQSKNKPRRKKPQHTEHERTTITSRRYKVNQIK